jgi:hypothetical protein
MKVTRVKAIQPHPVPSTVTEPKGPFPPELFDEPRSITEYEPALSEDGSNFPNGSTAQNNFSEVRLLVCGSCFEKVLSTQTEEHICGESNGQELQ